MTRPLMYCATLVLAAFATLPAPVQAAPRALVVLSSIDHVPGAPNATGNYLREVAWPVVLLERAGIEVDFVAPRGEPALVRGNEAYGFEADLAREPVLREFADRHLRGGRIGAVRAPRTIDPARYDAIAYTGSLGALIDVARDEDIARIALAIHARGGWIATFGHGIAGLLPLRAADASPWLAGRRVACFPQRDDEAFFFDDLGWRDALPYHIERRVRDAGAIVVEPAGTAPHVVEEGRLLSSQNAAAAEALGQRLVARLLEAR